MWAGHPDGFLQVNPMWAGHPDGFLQVKMVELKTYELCVKNQVEFTLQ